MLLSWKRAMRITHRSPNIYHKLTLLSFKVCMTFTLNDIDLHMTLTFDWYLVEYKHSWIMWIMKFYSFDLDLDPMTLMLKCNLNVVKMYVCVWKWSSVLQQFKSYSLKRYTDRIFWNRQTRLKLLPTHIREQMVKMANFLLVRKFRDLPLCEA